MTGHRDDRGFTLPELLVAITLLGVIMVAIGTMITTSFRTTSIVQSQLTASRGPKMTSRYWVPDVESADAVNDPSAARCGSGDEHIATLTWNQESSTIDELDVPAADGPVQTVTWWRKNGARTQLVRDLCSAGGSGP